MQKRPVIDLVKAKDPLMTPQRSFAVFCDNLDFLLRHYEMSCMECGKRAGMSGKSIMNVRNKLMAPSIENAAKIASAFDLQLWQMLIPINERTIIPTHEYVVSFRRLVERGVALLSPVYAQNNRLNSNERERKNLTAVM